MKRFGIHVSGLVQGVGFRPFLHRLALEHRIYGSVRNTRDGVLVDAEGSSPALLSFLSDIRDRAPQCARIERISVASYPLSGESTFKIAPSDVESMQEGETVTSVPKDLAPCDTCLRELRDPANRRYRYPFITCNMCGPRYTIAEHLPFDRHHTAMADFSMCSACALEFTSPHDRRYHAQTMSCPDCGPLLSWSHNETHERGEKAFATALMAIKHGGVIAVKGVGGFHLICMAQNSAAVERIRRIKKRPMKPLAVMAPDLQAVRDVCEVPTLAASWLCSAAAPIVLLQRKMDVLDSFISAYVAPRTTTLGVMLPSNPLYAMLAEELGAWLVVTSANHSGAPTEITEDGVQEFAGSLIDGILSHNRRITHLADDSVGRIGGDQMIVLRHGRGLAPTEVIVQNPSSHQGAALGAHQKASFALRVGQKIVLSPYIGDWEHADTRPAFMREWATLSELYGLPHRKLADMGILACDSHPHYGSSVLAAEQHSHPVHVRHHAAHLESLIAERGFSGRALGVVWDGTGLGDDGTIWGGEFFLVNGSERERIASIRTIPLWGADQAIREPRRTALGLVWESTDHHVDQVPYWLENTSDLERSFLPMAFGLRSGILTSSSIGRMFDGMAALLGIDAAVHYEAQAAMALENLARKSKGCRALPIVWERDDDGLLRWDWRDLVKGALQAKAEQERIQFAADFHATLSRVIAELARIVEVKTILFTGGVFQNALLMDLCVAECAYRNLKYLTHTYVPPGDGGLALGQLRIAERV